MKSCNASDCYPRQAILDMQGILLHVLILISIIPGTSWAQNYVGKAASPRMKRAVVAAESNSQLEFFKYPKIEPIEMAFLESGLRWAAIAAFLKYDEQGVVHEVNLAQTSGNVELDKEFIAWSKKIRATSSASGVARLPMFFVVDQAGCEIDPSLSFCINSMPLSSMLDEAKIRRLRAEFALFHSREWAATVYFDHDDAGHVTRAGVVGSAGLDVMDKEIVQYLRASSIVVNAAGSVSMPLRFLKIFDSEPRIDDAEIIQVRVLHEKDSRLIFSKDAMEVFLSVHYQRLDFSIPEDFYRFQIEYDAFGKVTALHGSDGRLMTELADFFRSYESHFRLFPKRSLPLQPGSLRVCLYLDGSLVPEESACTAVHRQAAACAVDCGS